MSRQIAAVRSDDLNAERWDLICWDSVAKVAPYIEGILVLNRNKFLITESINEIALFLSGDRSYDHLLTGWANLLVHTELTDNIQYNAWEREARNFPGLETLPYNGLRSLARTCHEGATKYGENNWLLGFQVTGLLNHAVRHLIRYGNGDRTEDHRGHSSWGFMTSVYFLNHRPECCKLLLGPNYTLTEEIREYLTEHENRRQIEKQNRNAESASSVASIGSCASVTVSRP